MSQRRLSLGILCVAMVFFVSCREETEKANPMDSGVEVDENPKTAALNPEHGKPGHRCDIPVGAPLDGSLSLERMLNGNPDPKQTTTSDKSPVEINQRPAKNPPHGQPFHDCDLPVGAALN